ncbi:MAG: phytoene/squalene synthase family protein, partial [Gordonia sp. (in: high G+C Gram-positive bacteria)]
VCTAHDLFAELSVRLRRVPAEYAAHHRVRVPARTKARIAAAAIARRGRPVGIR